ncbi:MAG: hypothetical protein NVS3B26_25490 [Mycobacteriales bacterium]
MRAPADLDRTWKRPKADAGVLAAGSGLLNGTKHIERLTHLRRLQIWVLIAQDAMDREIMRPGRPVHAVPAAGEDVGDGVYKVRAHPAGGRLGDLNPIVAPDASRLGCSDPGHDRRDCKALSILLVPDPARHKTALERPHLPLSGAWAGTGDDRRKRPLPSADSAATQESVARDPALGDQVRD